jgi:acyl carrier protein
MKIETMDQILNLFRQKRFNIEDVILDKCGVKMDYTAKTFGEMGLDGLDMVEMAMEIEKLLDCVITDEFLETWDYTNPNTFSIANARDAKLTELGI